MQKIEKQIVSNNIIYMENTTIQNKLSQRMKNKMGLTSNLTQKRKYRRN